MKTQHQNKSNKPTHIVPIPTEYEADFKADPIVSWQSWGDEGHHADFPYFTNPSKIHEAIVNRSNPFDEETLSFDNDFICNENDRHLRFIHTDLGLVHDSCGISMCHISDWLPVTISKTDENTGEKIVDRELFPLFYFDFIGRIPAPDSGEIIFSKVRELIYELDSRGFPIQLITYDRYQSQDSIQILREKGFIVDHLSMDRTATYPILDVDGKNHIRRVKSSTDKFGYISAWSHFKQAISTGRVNIPKYLILENLDIEQYGLIQDLSGTSTSITWVEKEMLQAIYDSKKIKVKEPPTGTIDLLESLVGAAYNANNNVGYEPPETPDSQYRKKKLMREDDSIFNQSSARVDTIDEVPESDFEDDSVFE
jgi:hypothetical protein